MIFAIGFLMIILGFLSFFLQELTEDNKWLKSRLDEWIDETYKTRKALEESELLLKAEKEQCAAWEHSSTVNHDMWREACARSDELSRKLRVATDLNDVYEGSMHIKQEVKLTAGLALILRFIQSNQRLLEESSELQQAVTNIEEIAAVQEDRET